jgi:uncharacterized protein (UPF0128 family)
MKYLLALSLLALITALSMKPTSIEERVEEQIQQSEILHDTAMILLKELHDKERFTNRQILSQWKITS